MPAAVISIDSRRRGFWSLLEVARPGRKPAPYGILLTDEDGRGWAWRLRPPGCFGDLDEGERDILEALPADFEMKAREMGGLALLASLEDSLSGFFRISDRESIAFSNADAAVDRLFGQYVDAEPRKFITHLPLYGLRAAATRFGEGMDAEEEGWILAPQNLRLTHGMFAAHVVGRSMEPRIRDGSVCIFRSPVTGSRAGRLLLIEKFGETDFAARYTVKRYARSGPRDESADREHPIRLEPLNPEFEAFDLTSDQFRVVAEFVQVLYP